MPLAVPDMMHKESNYVHVAENILFWLDKCFEFITYRQCVGIYAYLVLNTYDIITQDKQPFKILMALLFGSHSIKIKEDN